MSDPKSDPKPDQGAEMTAAEAVKLFAKSGITVAVVKRDGKGAAVRDPVKRCIVTEAKPLAPEHIIAVRQYEGGVTIATVDGRKYCQVTK